MHGEAGSVDINDDQVQEAPNAVKASIAQYKPSDVYNMDETGLFYSQAPTRTISKEPVAEMNLDKKRITVVLPCNSDGSHELPAMLIGHRATSRSISGRSKCLLFCLNPVV